MNRKLSLWHFWTMFIFFNLTFFPLFLVGLLGQPRRVFEYAQNLQPLNDISSVSAFFLGASFLIFLVNFVWSVYINPRGARQPMALQGSGVADGDADAVVQLRADPGRPRRSLPLRGTGRSAGGRPRQGAHRGRRVPSEPVDPDDLSPGGATRPRPRPPIL